jgi:transposase InsO family protein
VFQTFDEARRVIATGIQWYNQKRPHQALGYQSSFSIGVTINAGGRAFLLVTHRAKSEQHFEIRSAT